MSQFLCKVIACDRCGNHIFVKQNGENVLDGGYTRVPCYEKTPDGWIRVDITSRYVDLCPECADLWKQKVSEFYGGNE